MVKVRLNKMKSITRQTCYKMKVNSYLLYHDYCKPESESKRWGRRSMTSQSWGEFLRRSRIHRTMLHNSCYTQEQPIRPQSWPLLINIWLAMLQWVTQWVVRAIKFRLCPVTPHSGLWEVGACWHPALQDHPLFSALRTLHLNDIYM